MSGARASECARHRHRISALQTASIQIIYMDLHGRSETTLGLPKLNIHP